MFLVLFRSLKISCVYLEIRLKLQWKMICMKNDMLDFNVIKFFGINTCSGKFFRHLPARWKFSSPGWVKINTDGAARGYPGLATCGGIFRGSMRKFIGSFYVLIDIQTVLVAEFFGVIYTMEEA